MAKPRVFVSSTYYDLKHVRSSLENFIESLGFEAILSEKGDIAYAPDTPLDESCYREAASADIFVLIVGGRYGSAASNEEKKLPPGFFERYDSITKKEFDSAIARDVPTYILIENSVNTEFGTYLRNKDKKDFTYAYVDSVNIFRLIEEIRSKPKNNPIHTFERFSDIQSWLREQWAGLFRELLQRMSGQQQLASLASQVQTLSAINETLQRYLEALMKKISPDEATELIESERKRLNKVVIENLGITAEQFRALLINSDSVGDFVKRTSTLAKVKEGEPYQYLTPDMEGSPFEALNACREIVRRPHYPPYKPKKKRSS
jgi:hypothetical protein